MITDTGLAAYVRAFLINKGWKIEGLKVQVLRDQASMQRTVRMYYHGKATALTITFGEEVVGLGFTAIAAVLPSYLDYTKALLSEKARQ